MTRATLSRDHPEVEEWVGELRASITRLSRSQYAERQRDPRALPLSLLSALSRLESLGPMTPTRLAAFEGVRKPSMTRALATLTEAGLVTRTVDVADGRQLMVAISAAGLAALEESRAILDQWYNHRLDPLSSGDHGRLNAAVAALSRLAGERPHHGHGGA